MTPEEDQLSPLAKLPTWIRVTRYAQPDPRLNLKPIGRRAIKKFEVVVNGEVVAEIGGVVDLRTEYPIDGVVVMYLGTALFEEVIEERPTPDA